MKKAARFPLFLTAMALLLSLAVLSVALPDRVRSDLENRTLAGPPVLSASSVLSGRWMKGAETYIDDQFFARDQWMALAALWDAALLRVERRGVLLGKDGRLFEASSSLSDRVAQEGIHALDALAEATGLPVTLLLAPMSSAVYPEELPAFAPADDQAALLARLYAGAGQVRTVDALTALRAAKGEQPLYYRTDHHWTAVGALAAYRALTDALGLREAETAYTVFSAEGFSGSYFARAPSPLVRSETLTFDVFDNLLLSVEGEPVDGLYDEEQMARRDKYAALLYGNHSRITLENTSGSASGTLLVLKDSYANALLPHLAQHYRRVEVVDLRYFVGDLPALLQELDVEGIVCIYGLSTFLTDRNLLLHSAAWED